MKKLISLLLALVMVFSITTVAFAEETTPDENPGVTDEVPGDETTDEEAAPEGEETDPLQFLLDLPFWTVKPMLKFAKIALKLVKLYVKIAVIFGIIDKNDIIGQIEDLIAGALGDGTTDEEVEQAPDTGDVETPAAA